MINKKYIILSLSSILTFSYQTYCQGLKANPIQPWSGYTVHSMSRPKPLKVLGGKCLCFAPPKDAIVFIGEGTENTMKVAWPMENGVMTANKVGNNYTTQIFSDCQVHIEWRVPKDTSVTGQKGANSGIFLMDLYEIQIQESHKNITYADGQAAAIYGQFPPLVNPALPQGEWQSYDITFKAPVFKDGKMLSPAYVTLLFNGIVVHANQPLKGPTVFRKVSQYSVTDKHPEKAPHRLQWHQDKIEFRNFWVRDLTVTPYSQKK